MDFWERILDKHGLAVAFLVVTIAALYLVSRYIVVPLVNKLLAALEKQVDEARESRKEDQREFLSALERRDRVAEEQNRLFAEAMRRAETRRGGEHG